VLRTGQHSAARFVGSQASVELESGLTMHMGVSVSVVLFIAGTFLKDTSPGRDTRYLSGHVSYRF